MSRKEDIGALLTEASSQIQSIEREYNRSLDDKTVSTELRIFIKNYCENLRSPLDYIASEIDESVLGLLRNKTPYFPMNSTDRAAYDKYMSKQFPQLSNARPDLYQAIEEIQPYNPSGCQSLPRLNELVNKNKHDQLSPQKRVEERGVCLELDGGSITLGPGCSISGHGTISSGNSLVVVQGQPISGASPATIGRNVRQRVEIWVSFQFTDGGDDVLRLLKEAHADVARIFRKLESLIWT